LALVLSFCAVHWLAFCGAPLMPNEVLREYRWDGSAVTGEVSLRSRVIAKR